MAQSQCLPTPDAPCRVNLDLMPADTATWMYALTALGFLVFAYGIYQMVSVWRLGQAWKTGDLKEGAKRFVVAIMTHRKFRQQRKPGEMHAYIFFGFLALFITTTIVAIDADFFELILGKKLLFGYQYLFLEAFADFFGLVFVLGLAYAMHRRYVVNPKHLPNRPGDLAALLFLLAIGLTGFVMEALRLQHQVLEHGINYASWSFVGEAIRRLAFRSLTTADIQPIYQTLWWTHFALWTSTYAILPWTKMRHIVTSSLNILFTDPKRQALPELNAPFDLPKMMAEGDTDLPTTVGVSTIRDFTWKDRLALDACTNCGRCESMCPADKAGRPLSPRQLIQDLRDEMWRDYKEGRGNKDHQPRKLTEANGVSQAIEETTLWSCTTCRACMTECPVDINHVDLIVDMRRALVMDSKLDEHQSNLLVNLTNTGNPYGFAASDRADWTAGLPSGVKVPLASDKAARGEGVDTLWWVGCSGSYDPRNNEVTRSVATILNAAEVDFAILGTEERCNGDPARRLGEEGRFQQSVMENLATLTQYGVKTIITQCPHCFNTFANEYPQFGGDFEVIHHTQYIERLIDDGKLPLKDGAEMKVTYHDSCYLGRHNGIFDAPRRVLEKTGGGLPVLEMAQSKEQGLCCGAGGANMWYEVPEEGDRINVIRAKQAAETGADTVATACPFCLTMMKDGLSLTGNDEEGGGSMVALDLAEIVARNLDWEPVAEESAGDDTPSPGEQAAAAPVWVG